LTCTWLGMESVWRMVEVRYRNGREGYVREDNPFLICHFPS
jgi:hypothetical protein